MQGNSGKRDNRILKISMITVAVITCLFAVLKVANVFDVTKVATKAAAFVQNGFKATAGNESDGTVDTITVNGTSYTVDQVTKTINVTLPYTAEDMVTIDATKKDDNQKIEGIGSAILNSNNRLTKEIVVTSADETSTNTYTVNITKESSLKLKNIQIAGGTIAPTFSSDTTEYTISILSNITSIDVSATCYDRNAVAVVSGNDNLTNNSNDITITVTNPNLSGSMVYHVDAQKITEVTWNYTTVGSSSNPYTKFTVPSTGLYKIECWGASGEDRISVAGGNGGYTSGEIILERGTELYAYIGGRGNWKTGGYNGGGNSIDTLDQAMGGGGATDIRLVSGAWNNTASLRSRIMVAGGGGGSALAQSRTPKYCGNRRCCWRIKWL